MGREICDREFSAKDYERFNHCIHDQVDILKKIISKPKFGNNKTCIGAELELYLMNKKSDVSPVNLQLLEMLDDDQFQSELNKFNIELNLSPVNAEGKPFTSLTKEMLSKFNYLWSVAEQIDTRPLAVGILPTLKEKHLTNEYLTDLGRYRILGRELLKQRGEPFHIKIEGTEESVDFLESLNVKFYKSSSLAKRGEVISLKIDGQTLPKILETFSSKELNLIV